MNPAVISREQILQVCRELIQQQGWSAVSIRAVAGACGISVGSIYNYFQNKTQLLEAAVESVWLDIFPMPPVQTADTLACVGWLFTCLEAGSRRYPNFFTMHSMAFLGADRPEGQKQMARSWAHMRRSIAQVIAADPKVRPGIWDGAFSPEDLAGILFSLLVSALVRQDYDSTAVAAMVQRILY